MAKQATDTISAAAAALPVREEPTVTVFIPLAEEAENNAKVDQTEHVTINGQTTVIRRGEYVNVRIPIYLQLKTRYPNL